uniref:Pre-mRNA-splicing factor SYF2 n=1 Tax=Compsopogon caeruleus TaxID=31354 RepID=A0A7S1TGY4_9RHOD|mmetsp:Transcript_7086/g.14587  ORF Transcript_7086/g.14587 Transcript_7086/m.14587 type:complete len:253 (+) Transcript_7086:88-846(+)|eukprot:CAMPEP_0184686320 /NCGR_PEP_ID=MMETSP0312-20130426/22013_1 /TAXON_ID=31354 /ORGANISM="Compsopogon coeruleus, Strain SAG 36.94" /LENGTH=252 /DNA_ID=CAMNT_0027141271 /DNA_START=52 /DNA_END=810 /DNA_ORIENTATION=+
MDDVESRLAVVRGKIAAGREENMLEVGRESERGRSRPGEEEEWAARRAEWSEKKASREARRKARMIFGEHVDWKDKSAGEAEDSKEKRRQRAGVKNMDGLDVFSVEAVRLAHERRLRVLPTANSGMGNGVTVDSTSKVQYRGGRRVEPAGVEKERGSSAGETAGGFGNKPVGRGRDGPVDNADAVERMVAELVATQKRREKFKRRRAFDEDVEDINYINERNRRFNQKVGRSFDKYTEEIKQNLERGTALPD